MLTESSLWSAIRGCQIRNSKLKHALFSVWYKCVTMSGWDHRPCFSDSRNIRMCNFNLCLHYMHFSADTIEYVAPLKVQSAILENDCWYWNPAPKQINPSCQCSFTSSIIQSLFPCHGYKHSTIVLCGSVWAILFVSQLHSQGCVWTTDFFFSAHTEQSVSGLWGEIHWIWQKVYWIIIADSSLNSYFYWGNANYLHVYFWGCI